MAKCDFCGKDVKFGIKVSHSHRRSNRTYRESRRSLTALPPVYTLAPVAYVPVR